jgi:hypothetical protein
MEFRSNGIKIFISTLCDENVEDYDLFKVIKCYSIKDIFGSCVILIILQKESGICKWMKNGKMLSNKGHF